MPDMPSLEQIAADLEKKKQEKAGHKPDTDKTSGVPKEPTDVGTTVVENESDGVEKPVTVTTPDEVEPEAEEQQAKPEEKKDFLASRFAAISRKEKAARDAAAEVERMRADIEARAKALEEREATLRGAKRPLEILKAHGYGYKDATDDALGSWQEKEKDPVDAKLEERFSPLTKELEGYKSTIEEMKAELEQYRQERQQRAMHQFNSQILETAKDKGHELIVAAGDEAVALVRAVMQSYFESNKKVLTFEEACERVEAYYTDRISKLASVEKIKSRFAPTSAAPSKSSSKSEAKERPSTLTQSLSQGSRAKPDIDAMSRHDALELLSRQLRYV